MTGPLCIHCEVPSVRVGGDRIYPHRRDLYSRDFFLCESCGAYCGTHEQTGKPLGRPAGPELREARKLVHKRFDPIWLDAWRSYGSSFSAPDKAKFRRIARNRTYAFLAERLGLERTECHTAMFNIDQCRSALGVLKDVTYAEVRRWWKSQEQPRGKSA